MAKNPYYDADGTGDVPSTKEETTPTIAVPVPTIVESPKNPVVEKTIPIAVPVSPAIPIPQKPVRVPVPTPAVVPAPVKTSVPRTPVKPSLPKEKEELPVAVVPNGFKEVVESTPARQRSERTKFQFAPEPLPIDTEEIREIAEAPKSKGSKKTNLVKVNPYAGGRWKVITLRVGVWTVLGLVVLLGVKAIIFPSRQNIVTLSQQVGAQLGLNGFPIQSGQALAQSFAREYLTINPKLSDQRSTNLAHFLPQGKDQSSWTGVSSTAIPETIVSGPILIEAPTLFDTTHAVFTFGAQVKAGTSDPKWVYLAVTTFADANGLVTISGPPAFVNNPGFVDSSGAYPYVKSQTASDSLGVDLPGFLKAWAASDSVGIALYTQSDATPATIAGLGGAVSFVGINNLSVAAVDAKKPSSAFGQRYAEVDVTWKANGNTWVQGYRLTVLQTSEGKWYVQDIVGGGFGARP